MKGNSHEKLDGYISVEGNIGEGQERVDDSFLEGSLNSEADKVEGALKTLGVKIDNLAQENPEKADKLRKALRKLWNRFLTGFEVASVLFLAGTAADYEKTRYGVKENLNPDKTVSYVHEDKETNQILEFLSGRRELERQTRFELAKGKIMKDIDNSKIKYPKELKTATEEEFVKIILSMEKNAKYNDYIFYLAKLINEGKDVVGIFNPAKLEKADDIYTALWKIERLSGNPRIRWRDIESSVKGSMALGIRAEAYYDPITNTVYIRSPNMSTTHSFNFSKGIQAYESVDDFISETSHAKQFNEKLISTLATGFRDEIITFLDFIKTRDMAGAYRQNYARPSALEYEAHSVIEPELRKKFNEELKPEPEPEKHRESYRKPY